MRSTNLRKNESRYRSQRTIPRYGDWKAITTLPTTLEPTADLVRRRATRTGQDIELEAILCEGAFEALMAGSTESHDQSIAKALTELNERVVATVVHNAAGYILGYGLSRLFRVSKQDARTIA